MNREALLNRPKAKKFEDVKIGDEVVARVRRLKAAEVKYMQQHYQGDAIKALDGCRYIVATCTVDDAGNAVFEPKDIDGDLKEMDHDLVDAIATTALNFSGIKTPGKNA